MQMIRQSFNSLGPALFIFWNETSKIPRNLMRAVHYVLSPLLCVRASCPIPLCVDYGEAEETGHQLMNPSLALSV